MEYFKIVFNVSSEYKNVLAVTFNQSTQHSGPFPHLLVCQFQRSFKFLPVIALLAFRQLVRAGEGTGRSVAYFDSA